MNYLHNAGIVFHHPGLFRNSIVLDQGWALDAIYAVFNREKCYRELKRLRGRFTRPLLELLVWGEHSVAEQRLFLGMMPILRHLLRLSYSRRPAPGGR